jgi:glutamate racemase
MKNDFPIGIFDSGYGGLTVLSEIRKSLPNYDFIYFGDNARAPYGNRSFELVYDFTLEAVNYLFSQGCPLVILACNTASAKALRTIQQKDLEKIDPTKRVLGVIRPSAEEIGFLTSTKHVGILGTIGTIQSDSYKIELQKYAPEIIVSQHACPMWVPLIENDVHQTSAGKLFIEEDVRKLMLMDPKIDAIILACTHYPILQEQIQKIVGEKVKVISQGPIVAEKLSLYLDRNKDMEVRISRGGTCSYRTTENAIIFNKKASQFLGEEINAQQIEL